jgi:MFS family permease
MPAPNRHDPYAAFRYSNYRFYTFGLFFAEIGEQMLRVLVGYEIFQRTHSTLALGFIGFSIWLPIFLFMLPGGAVADRHNRKAIVLAGTLLFGLCAAGMALSPRASSPLPLMYGLLFLTGLTRAFNEPARRALLLHMVPPEHSTNAITWNSNVNQMGMVAGPALGGMLYALIGFSNSCFLVAALELAVFLNYGAIRRPAGGAKGEPIGLQSLRAGLGFVGRTKLILATITMDLFVVLFGGATAMLPAYADDILRCGSVGMGWLQAAIPLGAFLTSIAMAHRPPMKKAGPVLLWAVAGFGGVIIVFGISRWFWLSFLALSAAGALDLVSVIVRQTLVQVLTPDRMRGRVNAVSSIFISSSNELGGFESGVAATLLGLVPSVVLGGAASILVVLAVLRIWPEVANLKSLEKLKPAS